MIHTRSAGGVILNRNGDVLVVNQRGKSWSLPKGHIEDGEDALAAARREIEEESGVTQLDLVQELGTYERHKLNRHGQNDESELKRITMFLFKTEELDLAPKDPHNPEARWVPIDDVEALLTHEKDREFFRSVRSQLRELL